jgi:Holliday junction resolvase
MKGKRAELELAHKLVEYGFEARRGQQYCGSNGDADVVGLDGVHIECKRVEKLNLYDAVEQSVRDARDDEMPVVIHRKDRKPWIVTMQLDDFMELYKKLWRENANNI